jgi:hypothetical protein
MLTSVPAGAAFPESTYIIDNDALPGILPPCSLPSTPVVVARESPEHNPNTLTENYRPSHIAGTARRIYGALIRASPDAVGTSASQR